MDYAIKKLFCIQKFYRFVCKRSSNLHRVLAKIFKIQEKISLDFKSQCDFTHRLTLDSFKITQNDVPQK